MQFQSTLPTRGSDFCILLHNLFQRFYFNPRSPRGGATFGDDSYELWAGISIHAPHEGERRQHKKFQACRNDFNPRSPRGGATLSSVVFIASTPISIHAPHEGERPTMILYCPMFVIFQSTLPTRGSDILQNSHAVARVKFQSTLPTRGSDYRRIYWWQYGDYFNPRSPRGGATV